MASRDQYYSLRRRYRIIRSEIHDIDNPVIKRSLDLLVDDCILCDVSISSLGLGLDDLTFRHPLNLKSILFRKHGGSL
jgi:hypothetical protein